MSVTEAKISPTTEVMAEQVLEDIRDRGLVSGDRYLTAEQARSTFQVGKGLINDALKLLADRQVLVRKRRAGTFIGPRFSVESDSNVTAASSRAALDVVHVLIPMDYYRAKVIAGTTFVEELTRAIPGVSVQLHHIADDKTDEYTTDLVSQIKAKPDQRAGLVLLRSSRQTQLAVQDSGVPAIVFGSTYKDVTGLVSIDFDQEQAGRLAAEAALQRGHNRFALIMRNHWRRGDNILMEGLSAELGRAGIGIDRVRVLSTHEDAKVIEHDVDSLLGENPRPTALFCRSRFHADAAIRGIRDRGLEPGRDVLVICLQSYDSIPDGQIISIKPTLKSEEQVAKVGELLLEMARHRRYGNRVNLVPVRLSNNGS